MLKICMVGGPSSLIPISCHATMSKIPPFCTRVQRKAFLGVHNKTNKSELSLKILVFEGVFFSNPIFVFSTMCISLYYIRQYFYFSNGFYVIWVISCNHFFYSDFVFLNLVTKVNAVSIILTTTYFQEYSILEWNKTSIFTLKKSLTFLFIASSTTLRFSPRRDAISFVHSSDFEPSKGILNNDNKSYSIYGAWEFALNILSV